MSSSRKLSVASVLLAEDHEPFRHFVREILEQQHDLRLVGEAEDGWTAVRKCMELQPDMILLDIGLPRLNGIEAARQIRQLLPACRIVFLTGEQSPEMVHEALSLGAAAYVIKSHTARDLISAISAARDGCKFIASDIDGLRYPARPDFPGFSNYRRDETLCSPHASALRIHQVHFYRDDRSLVSGFADFIQSALKRGKAVTAPVTQSHREGIIGCLQASGLDANAAIKAGRFVPIDVVEMIAEFMAQDRLDPDCLLRMSIASVEELRRLNQGVSICACGEIAPTLHARGELEAAIQVERLWDELSRRYNLEIFCGYLVNHPQPPQHLPIYQEICAVHSIVASH